jgi:rhamnosyltransferase
MIDIVLATFNGEKFLEPQLFSLMSQTYKDWRCIIHDDGSSDGTLKILKKFCQMDSRFKLIDDGIVLKDAAKNFLHALSFSDSDFVCFCDQDDVWLDSKLEKLNSAILQKDNSFPQVVFSNSYLYRCSDSLIFGKATLAFPETVEDLLYLNCGIQGSAGIFNKKAADILKIGLEKMCMHDFYLTLAGITLGEVSYLHENLMLYRQHEKNVTGSASGNLKSKYKTFFKSKIPLVSRRHLESLESFYSVWNKNISEKDRKLIEKFIDSASKNKFSNFKFLLFSKFNIYGSHLKLMVKFFLRPYIG